MLPASAESWRPCDTPDSSIVDFSFRQAKRLHRFVSRHPDRACDVSRSKDRIGCNLPRALDQVTSSRIGSRPLPARPCSRRRSRLLSNGLSCLGSSRRCRDICGKYSFWTRRFCPVSLIAPAIIWQVWKFCSHQSPFFFGVANQPRERLQLSWQH